jgi:hypothetical protein
MAGGGVSESHMKARRAMRFAGFFACAGPHDIAF